MFCCYRSWVPGSSKVNDSIQVITWLLKLWTQNQPTHRMWAEIALTEEKSWSILINYPRKNKSSSRQWFSIFTKCPQHHLESILKQISGPCYRSSDSRSHGWGLRIGISNKVPGDEVTAGPGETYFETWRPHAQEHRLWMELGCPVEILLCHLTSVPNWKLLDSLWISISASVKWVVTYFKCNYTNL